MTSMYQYHSPRRTAGYLESSYQNKYNARTPSTVAGSPLANRFLMEDDNSRFQGLTSSHITRDLNHSTAPDFHASSSSPRNRDLGRSYLSSPRPKTSRGRPISPSATNRLRAKSADGQRRYRIEEQRYGNEDRSLALYKFKDELDRLTYASRVDLSYNYLNDGLAVEVARFIAGNRLLRELNLSGNDLTASGAMDIVLAAPTAVHLWKLDLSHNRIGDWTGMYSKYGFQEMCRALRTNMSITHLNLRGNRIKPSQVLYLSDMLRANQCITHLDLGHNDFGTLGGHHLKEGVKENRTILDCQLSASGIPADTMLTIAELLRQNKSFSGLDSRTREHQSYLKGAGVFSPRDMPVRASSPARSASPVRAASPRKDAVYLDSHKSEFDGSPYWARVLGSYQYSSVVDLSGRAMGDAGVLEVARWLAENKCCRELDLSDNHITGRGAAYLGEALMRNETLSRLTVSENPLGDLLGFLEFCRTTSSNRGLTHLALRHCKLTAFQTHSLKEIFLHNRGVHHMDLSFNDFGLIGGELLLEAVRKNYKLVDLQLSGCGMDVDALLAVAEHLQYNAKDAAL